MTNLTGNFERYVTVDCADVEGCRYCGNYSNPLRVDQFDHLVCEDFEACCWNRVENGDMTQERAEKLIDNKRRLQRMLRVR